MRFTAIITAALTVAATANAVSTDVQACITALNTANAQLATVSTKVAAFVSSSGLLGANTVHSAEQTLEANIVSASNACCAVHRVVNEEDAVAVISVIDVVVPAIENALGLIVSKKPQFDGVILATGIVKADLKNLKTKLTVLDDCLVANTPDNYASQADGYVTRVGDAFDAAFTAYGI